MWAYLKRMYLMPSVGTRMEANETIEEMKASPLFSHLDSG